MEYEWVIHWILHVDWVVPHSQLATLLCNSSKFDWNNSLIIGY